MNSEGPGSTEEELTDGGDPGLDAAIAAYLGSRDRDEGAWIGRHPEHAAGLARFFAGQALFIRPTEAGHREPNSGLPGPDDLVGAEFGGYRIVDLLGRGGMGLVYRARQSDPPRDVALKVIAAGHSSGPLASRRFRAEAEAIARLDHPGIVAIHEVGEVAGRAYFTMALAPGGSLLEHLAGLRAAGRSFDPRAAARLVAAAAGAVDHAHRRGVLHRDLKPGNILLGEGDRPIVTDFGLARSIDGGADFTEAGVILGSPRYLAPESVEGRPGSITTAVDIYGLGAILYACLTGGPPFGGATAAETLDLVRQSPPRPPRSINPGTPRDLETICLRCLAKSPTSRYPTAGAMAADLGRFLRGEPVEARRVGPIGRVAGWARRRPAQASLAAALALAVGLGGGGVAWQWRRALAAGKALEASLYAYRINLADRELTSGEVGRALATLDECPPPRRGWEWRHLRARRPLASRKAEPDSMILDMAYAGNGALAILESGPKEAAVRFAKDDRGPILWSRPAHRTGLARLAIDPAGRRIASASADGTARGFDAATGEPLWTYSATPPVPFWSIAFAPDGRTVALGENGPIHLVDAAGGRPLGRLDGHEDRVYALAFRPDGLRLVTAGDDGRAIVRHWPSRGTIRTLDEGSLLPIRSLAYSPDGRRLAGGTEAGAVVIWDDESGRELSRGVGHDNQPVGRIAFDPADGRRFATGGDDGIIKIWDADEGRELLAIPAVGPKILGLAFRPDGTALASAGVDLSIRQAPPPGLATRGEVRALAGHSALVTGVAFDPTGNGLATASHDRTVSIRDPKTGGERSRLRGHEGALTSLAYRPDGLELATAGWDRTVRIWDLRTGQARLSIAAPGRIVSAIAYRPRGKVLATGGHDGRVRLWEAATGREIVSAKFNGFIYDLDFDADGGRLAVAVGDGTARIIELPAWSLGRTIPGPLAWVGGVRFSPDGRRLAVAAQSAARVYDPADGRVLLNLEGLTAPARSIAWSPDGRRLATGSLDRIITLWDAATGRKIAESDEAIGVVARLGFDPSGHRLAATAGDSSALIWELPAEAPAPAP